MPPRKPKVVDFIEVPQLGLVRTEKQDDRIPLLLEPDMTFSARVNDTKVTGTTAQDVKERALEAVLAQTTIKWEKVIHIGYEQPWSRGDTHAISSMHTTVPQGEASLALAWQVVELAQHPNNPLNWVVREPPEGDWSDLDREARKANPMWGSHSFNHPASSIRAFQANSSTRVVIPWTPEAEVALRELTKRIQASQQQLRDLLKDGGAKITPQALGDVLFDKLTPATNEEDA